MEELNSGPPKTNPSSGREQDFNPWRPDYESSACLLQMNSQRIDKIDRFSYLGTVTDVQGGPDADVKARILKSRQAFTSLEPICSSQKTFLTTKVELYKTNVKTVLHYGSETWKSTQEIITKLRVFTYKCVRIILGIRWPQKVTDELRSAHDLLTRRQHGELNPEEIDLD